MGAFDDVSLHACLSLDMICFDGSDMISVPTTHDDQGSFVKGYAGITWNKALMLHAILKLFYISVYVDLDVVLMRPIIRAYSLAAELNEADIVSINDMNDGLPNAGNLYVKPNKRTFALIDEWIKKGFNINKTTGKYTLTATQNDKYALHSMSSKNVNDVKVVTDKPLYAWCQNASACASVKANGFAALWFHPNQGCIFNHEDTNYCGDDFAYLHL